MTDFKVMFPDMDADVIEAVLRANNGAVDTTIDHLLAMSADGNDLKQDSDQPPPAYTGQPPSYQQATNEPVTDDLINLEGATGGTPIPKEKNEEPSMDLMMSDFEKLGATASTASSSNPSMPSSEMSELKYAGSPKHAYSHPKRQEQDENKGNSNPNMLPTQQQLHEVYEENLRLREGSKGNSAKNQYLEDERIALMLQNEEFVAELQRDSEFMSALEMEQERAFYDQQLQKANKSSKPTMDSDEFREKLKNMSKSSKKKFSQMASMFSRRKNQLLNAAGAPSKDNLLLSAEPLVNEEDTDTEGEDPERGQTSTSGSGGGASGSSKKTPTKGKYTSFS